MILLTGASGFVGSHVAELAVARGLPLRALVRPRADSRRLVQLGVDLALGDVTDVDSVVRAAAGVSAVIHCAGLVKAVGEAEFARVNGFGSRNVADACRQAGVRRLIGVSSLAARGPDGAGGPVSAYGRSKLVGERELRRAEAAGTSVVVVRPTVVYGPRDTELLPLFLLAREGIRPVLRGGGVLSLIHGADLAMGLLGLADTDHRGGIFEASDGETYAWSAVLAAIACAVGRPGALLEVPDPVALAAAHATELLARLTHVPQMFNRDKLREMRGGWTADATPFWHAAGVRPEFGLEAGAVDTAMHYREAGILV